MWDTIFLAGANGRNQHHSAPKLLIYPCDRPIIKETFEYVQKRDTLLKELLDHAS
ncbi:MULTISPECIES: hypothetical protein [Nostocales]|uniref:Uncharacterized protein n=2 Tax=Nostocales TaxID=1161 RepID=A0A8S9T9M1_9CYAN|nr:hypothetical protein [Tolypothrix bouteillei]KAF3888707.1 hypothetical protein DA73_0400026905 [Tolypothrix bouteillei VB521301]